MQGFIRFDIRCGFAGDHHAAVVCRHSAGWIDAHPVMSQVSSALALRLPVLLRLTTQCEADGDLIPVGERHRLAIVAIVVSRTVVNSGVAVGGLIDS